MYVSRIIEKNLSNTLEKKSVLLLGPRQTGKSMMIRERIQVDRVFNLLDQSVFLGLSRRPSSLRESLLKTDKLIAIDEVQKLPQLLDEVHLMIEEEKRRFLLTGSSIRKLRRSYTKLLGGRMRTVHLHPFVYSEISQHFSLEKVLSHGCLPSIWNSDEPYADLRDYIGGYLQQEILAEAVTRGVDSYARFLNQIATSVTQILNFEKVAADAQLAPTTVRRFLDILKDTMIAYTIEPWKKGKQRKAISSAKLIFFDVGVVNCLLDIDKYNSKDANAGWQLEQYIGQELLAYVNYTNSRESLKFWRSQDKNEVDFILNDSIAIEVKHSEMVSERDLKGLIAISDEARWKRRIIVSRDSVPRLVQGIEIMPVKNFLENLWSDQL